MVSSDEEYKKKLTKEAQELAESKGGKCLSEYVNAKNYMEWVCGAGHTWDAELNRIRRGRWCKQCANDKTAVKLEDAQKVAESKGGKCLSRVGTYNKKAVFQWECALGHVWEAWYNNVKNATWCPTCSRERFASQSDALENAKKIAESKGGVCMEIYNSNRALFVTLMCKKGHIWDDFYTAIARRNCWCQACHAESLDKTERSKIARKQAQERGGDCLSEYVSKFHKMTWKCSNGHVWEAIYQNVTREKNPSWCPHCPWKNEENCRKIFEEILGVPTPKRRGIFTKYRMELDGYVEIHGVKIGWEYQGEQHYKNIPYFGNNLLKQQKLDQQKRDECVTLGIHLIEIPYTVKDKKDFIKEKLTETFLNLAYDDISEEFVELTGYLIERGILPDPEQDE